MFQKRSFAISFLLASCILHISAQTESSIVKRQIPPQSKELVCFYHSWNAARRGIAKFSPINMNPHLCTQLVYANGELDNEKGIRPMNPFIDIDENGYTLFTNLKRYNKNLKTLLGIGGAAAGSARFSALVTDEKRRKEFPKHAAQFLRQHNFDGINLNWQLPTLFEKSRPTDKENYVALTKELKEEFDREAIQSGKPKLLLTMCIPGVVDFIDKGFDIQKLSPILDWMYLLTYDFHTPFETYVSHHTPLYTSPEYPEYTLDTRLTVNYTINYLLRIGADRRKMIMGLPAYGRTYTLFNPDYNELGSPADGQGEQEKYTIEKGLIAFFEVCTEVKKSKGWTIESSNPDSMGPYAYRGNQWISFDDLDMIKLKTKYALDHEVGGILFMSMDMDDFRGSCYNRSYPLIETAREILIQHEFKKREKGKPSPDAAIRLHNMLTTPEPPATPDPNEDPTLTKARITRIVEQLLKNQQTTKNISVENASNLVVKEIASNKHNDISPLSLSIPTTEPENSPSTEKSEEPPELPNLSMIFPENNKVDDTSNYQTFLNALQNSHKNQQVPIETQQSSPNSNKFGTIYMIYPPTVSNLLTEQGFSPNVPKGTTGAQGQRPPTKLSNGVSLANQSNDDKVKIKVLYRGENQEISISIK